MRGFCIACFSLVVLVIVLVCCGLGPFKGTIGSYFEQAPDRAYRSEGRGGPMPTRGVAIPVVASLSSLMEASPGDHQPGVGSGTKRLEPSYPRRSRFDRRAVDSTRVLKPDPRLARMGQDGPFDKALTLRRSFESIDADTCCGGGVVNPPDPALAVGRDHVVLATNGGLQIHNTGGASVWGPVPLPTFFSPLAGAPCAIDAFDPNVLYDESTDRYIVAADSGFTHYCVAASQTGDPTGNWFFYAFELRTLPSFDRPDAGIGRDALYMGGTILSTPKQGQIWAFDKAALYAGQPATFVTHMLGIDQAPRPLHLHGWDQGTWPAKGGHAILAGRFGATLGQFRHYRWLDPFGANVLSGPTTVDVGASHGFAIGPPIRARQAGGGRLSNPIDDQPLDFEFRNGRGWMTNHVSCDPGHGVVDCVQWAEIDLKTIAVVQAGVFATADTDRIYPSLAVNHCGDMAVGYTRTGPSAFPSVAITGRTASDPPGTVQAETIVRLGDLAMGRPERWGDYTSMAIAPDGLTFWYAGQFAKALSSPANWGTQLVSFRESSCYVQPGFCPIDSPCSPFPRSPCYCG